MHLPDRRLLVAMSLGATFGVLAGMVGPGIAQDSVLELQDQPAIDPDQLVKFEGREYLVENADWVSTDAESTSVIQKIEGGRTSYVTVTTTATGTYSTDGLFSEHIQYPGVTVTEVSDYRAPNRFSYWTSNGWTSVRVRLGNSFTYYSISR
jgi:hypothetical protein